MIDVVDLPHRAVDVFGDPAEVVIRGIESVFGENLSSQQLAALAVEVARQEQGLGRFVPRSVVKGVSVRSGTLEIDAIQLDTNPPTIIKPANGGAIQSGIRKGDQLIFTAKEPLKIGLSTVFKGAMDIQRVSLSSGSDEVDIVSTSLPAMDFVERVHDFIKKSRSLLKEQSLSAILRELAARQVEVVCKLERYQPDAVVKDVVTSPDSLEVVAIRLRTDPVTIINPAKEEMVESGIRAGSKVSFSAKEPIKEHGITAFTEARNIHKVNEPERVRIAKH